MALVYHSHYNLDLPSHVFPAFKYSQIYNKLKQDPRFASWDVHLPKPASREELELVHPIEYLEDLFSYEHTSRTHLSELPLTQSIVESFLLGVGGTILASELTQSHSYAFNIGGGYHHSFPDRAEGFCYLNDIAIAIRKRQRIFSNERVLVIDLDLHQGNGNSFIFQNDERVFTFSMHQENIYPKKEPSNLDIPLPNGIQDKEYLVLLHEALSEIQKSFKPEFVFYVAGADPYLDDSLGDLKLSIKGLQDRDSMVKEFCHNLEIPCVITLGGGYARDFRHTIQIHFNTLQAFSE